MRWTVFAIFAYGLLGIQTGIDSFMRAELGASVVAELNLVLVGVIFLCIFAPRQDALLGSVLLGLLQDVATQQTFGLFGFGYGLVALVVTGLVQAVHKDHPLTHFSFTLLGGFMIALLIGLHSWWHPYDAAVGPRDAARSAVQQHAGVFVNSVIYSALAAVAVIGILKRFKRQFGFYTARPRMGSR